MSALDLDFSIKGAPASWLDNEADQDESETVWRPKRKKHLTHLKGKPADVFTGATVMLLLGSVCGYAWYEGQLQENSPLAVWAIPIGILYAIVIRLASGKGDPDIRSMLSAIFYAVTVFGSAYMVIRHDFILIYGHEPGPSDIDHFMIRDRLQQPRVILSWAAGFWATIHVSYMTHGRKRGSLTG